MPQITTPQVIELYLQTVIASKEQLALAIDTQKEELFLADEKMSQIDFHIQDCKELLELEEKNHEQNDRDAVSTRPQQDH